MCFILNVVSVCVYIAVFSCILFNIVFPLQKMFKLKENWIITCKKKIQFNGCFIKLGNERI